MILGRNSNLHSVGNGKYMGTCNTLFSLGILNKKAIKVPCGVFFIILEVKCMVNSRKDGGWKSNCCKNHMQYIKWYFKAHSDKLKKFILQTLQQKTKQ